MDSSMREMLHEMMFLTLTNTVREKTTPAVETGFTDHDGTPIKTGDLLEFWLQKTGGPLLEAPGEGVESVREVVVVQREGDEFFGVDYDIMKGASIDRFNTNARVKGSVHTDEGMEFLRGGLAAFREVEEAGEEE